jgi:hypothetical protein
VVVVLHRSLFRGASATPAADSRGRSTPPPPAGLPDELVQWRAAPRYDRLRKICRRLPLALATLAPMNPLPVLWLIGPSGVGKSTVGFELFGQVERAGTRAGYLDLDQVGLCYPARPDDPENHRVKAAGLAAVWPNFRADFADLCVDTDGVPVPEVARLVRERTGGWPHLT